MQRFLFIGVIGNQVLVGDWHLPRRYDPHHLRQEVTTPGGRGV